VRCRRRRRRPSSVHQVLRGKDVTHSRIVWVALQGVQLLLAVEAGYMGCLGDAGASLGATGNFSVTVSVRCRRRRRRPSVLHSAGF